jgi:hypothetical protein
MVLLALVAAGLAARRSFLTRRAHAASAAATPAAFGEAGGTWRVIQSQRGQTVRDYLVARVIQLGARGAGGTPLPDDALRALRARGQRLPDGLECVVVNKSPWRVREVCVEARVWQDQHTTRTIVYRVACDLRPGRTGTLDVPLPLDAAFEQRTELQVTSALGESPFGQPARW